MPSVHRLVRVDGDVFRYQLDTFSNGAVRFTPDYEVRFDLSDVGAIKWEPHGAHDFRSWGCFHTQEGAVPQEVVLTIDTKAEAMVSIDPIMLSLVEPFANESSERVTDGFLANIKAYVEQRSQA